MAGLLDDATRCASNLTPRFTRRSGAQRNDGQNERIVMCKRIQRKRTKGWKIPENTVYVGRGSKWGNAFTVDDYGREKAVQMFRDYIGHPNSPHGFEPNEIEELRGKNLACWCREDQACHADVLLEFANT